jgi:hypothetical protein
MSSARSERAPATAKAVPVDSLMMAVALLTRVYPCVTPRLFAHKSKAYSAFSNKLRNEFAC